jgi:hypothetical protein
MDQEVKVEKQARDWPATIFYALWALTTAGMAWLILRGEASFDSPATLPALLALFVCTLALLGWLPAPQLAEEETAVIVERGRFWPVLLAAAVFLFLVATVVGPPLIFALPVIAIAILAWQRRPIPRQEWLYALGLALIAGLAALGAGWIEDFSPLAWAVLQLALVPTSLLAGWSLLRQASLWPAKNHGQGLGISRLLVTGGWPALRGFGLGILLAMPWALSLVVVGGSSGDSWVQHWWQPFLAIQPAISEEAWGRVLLVPLMFLVLRGRAQTGRALNAAVIVMAYWFAYLHTARDLSLGALLSAIMIGTLYSLPVSYLWLRRDLETAIGFHFWQDFVRFSFALLLNAGIWPR